MSFRCIPARNMPMSYNHGLLYTLLDFFFHILESSTLQWPALVHIHSTIIEQHFFVQCDCLAKSGWKCRIDRLGRFSINQYARIRSSSSCPYNVVVRGTLHGSISRIHLLCGGHMRGSFRVCIPRESVHSPIRRRRGGLANLAAWAILSVSASVSESPSFSAFFGFFGLFFLAFSTADLITLQSFESCVPFLP